MATKKEKQQEHQSALDAMRASLKEHQWPDEIALPQDYMHCLSVYQKVILNRPHDSWFPGDLLEVARYARLLTDTEQCYRQLQVEGWTVLGGRNGNTMVENPMLRVHSNFCVQLGAIARRLNLATSYREGGNKSRETQDNRAKKERDAKTTLTNIDPNSLI